MSSKKKMIGLALLLMSLLALGACTPGADAEPTPDTNMVYTQAAETVAAQLTNQAPKEPTLDPNLIRTEAAQTVEAEIAKKATNTPIATLPPLGTLAPLPALASPTPALPVSSAGNAAEWRGQWPADGSDITVTNDTDVQWTLKNIGTKTWTTEYQYRFYLGETQFHKYTSYKLPKQVLPGEEVTITVDMKSTMPKGNYYEMWVLTDENGINFSQFDVRFSVGGAAAPVNTREYCCVNHEHPKPDGSFTLQPVCKDWLASLTPPFPGATTWQDLKDGCTQAGLPIK